MVSNVSIFLLASILVTRFETCRHAVSGQEEVMTPFMLPLPMGNHPRATELVNCHSLLYNRSNLNSISHSTQGPEECVGLKSHSVYYCI